MPYPILGTPKPAFFDSSGSPLVGGTLTIKDPTADTNKASYITYNAAVALGSTNSNPMTLDSRGEPTNELWGLDGEDYKVVLADSAGANVWTADDVRVPIILPYLQTAAELAAGVTPTNVEYPPGDVRRYGAVGDGVTDDTTALQNAGATTHPVSAPDGTWIVSNLAWTTDIDLTLSDGATIKHKDSAADHMIESTARLVIRGGTLDGNKANQTGRYDLVNGSGAELIVENTRITNSVKSGVNANGVSGMVRICGNYFTGMAEHSGVAGETSKCVDVNGTTPVIQICDNVCIGDTPSDANAAPGGFFLSGTSQSARITGNYFRNIGCDNASNPIASIQLYTDSDETVIANNIIEDYYYSPIKCQNGNNVTITGNVLKNIAGAFTGGQLLFGHARSNATAIVRATITGNIIDINGETTNSGIYITGDSAGVLPSYGVTVSGNSIDGGNIGIKAEWVTDITITGNTIRKLAGTAPRGITLGDFADDRTIVNITANTLVDAGSVYIDCLTADNNDNCSIAIGSNVFQVDTGSPAYFVQITGASGQLLEKVAIIGNIGNGSCSTADFQVTWCDNLTVTGNNSTANTLGSSTANTTNVYEVGNSWQALQTYTPTNVSTDRAYDADTVAVAELADVVGTLIADLQTQGIIT